MQLSIDLEAEVDGRWIAEIHELPGVVAYGASRTEAAERVRVLALRVLADRLEHGESIPEVDLLFAVNL
jgi:predicted RNase H-like HicB family nuclease